MFGFSAGEIFALLMLILLPYALVKAMRNPKMRDTLLSRGFRRCLACSYSGRMKTWLGNNSAPQLLAFILLLFYIVPGIIFIAWGSGRYKCPSCGSLKTAAATPEESKQAEKKKCPFCAEQVLAEAVVCKHCNRDIPAQA